MAKIISPQNLTKYLTCPFCRTGGTTLVVMKTGARCRNCKRKYTVSNNILELVRLNDLNNDARKELKGNSYVRTKEDAEHYANKDEWSNYYNHFADQKVGYLLAYLKPLDPKGVISLGSGTGYELKEILKHKKLSLVLSSDLALASTKVVPLTLKNNKLKIGLFTSDLNRPPVRGDTSLPIIIYEALHHTGDMHRTIEEFLQRNYKNLFFVEPTTNFLINFLARFGLAQRVEYSGLKPEFLKIGVLKKLARKYKYELKIRTLWHIPEDYFRIICKKNSKLEGPLITFIDLLSYLGNIFQFGSFSIVYLRRVDRQNR